MARRCVDVLVAGLVLALTWPLLLLSAIAIRLSSPGPVLYRARRIGRGGNPFMMLKLRTMHKDSGGDRITGPQDDRVFPAGRLLRFTKIDELPQLVNVLRGEMSLLGPRPEDPQIIFHHYTGLHFQTLAVRPGLASPGSLYHTTHGDRILAGGDCETRYVQRLLPVKLALDLVAIRRAGLAYDLGLAARTLGVLVLRLFGRREFDNPPELAEAMELIEPARRARRDPRIEARQPVHA